LNQKARWFQQNSTFLTQEGYFYLITVLQKYRLCLKYIQNERIKKNYLYVQLSIHGLSDIHFKTVLSVSLSENVSEDDNKKPKRVVKSDIRNSITHTTV